MDADESYIAQDSACHTPQADDLASSLLNFTTTPVDFELQSVKRQKTSRDPMSHRIIEKRRRDRMNNCLADLSRLIPTSYLKQGQGRIEKTEIIEMAIKHIKTLQAQVDSMQCQNFGAAQRSQDSGSNNETHKAGENACCHEKFYQGFKECQDETLNYFIEGEAMLASDPFCLRIMEHLSAVAQFGQSCDDSHSVCKGSKMRSHVEDEGQVMNRDTMAEDKHNLQADLDTKQMAGSSSIFRGSPSIPCQPGQEPMLPLPPMTNSMIVPASPIRDKHLRNLLATRALQQLETEREGTMPQNKAAHGSSGDTASLISLPACSTACSQVSSPQTAGSTITSASGDASPPSAGKNWDGSVTEGVSSGYVSDISAVDRLSNSTSSGDLMKDNSVMNIYKFKHNITKRFSQEGKVISRQYDGSSTSSREADEDLHHHGSVKYRSLKSKCRHASSSDSGPYSTSECSGAASSSSHESVEGSHDKKCRKLGSRSMGHSDRGGKGVECCTRSSVPLPGFVLHPSGTHYMPMSVCHSSLPDIFDAGAEAGMGPPVFHPISIPVHFRGPVISMPGTSISAVNAPCSSVINPFSASQSDLKVMKKGQDL